jgi:integrase/recombinase XerD
MGPVIEAFLKDCQDRGMTPETIRTYGWNIKVFLKYLGDKRPQDVGRADLKGYLDYLRSRGVSKKTVDIYFVTLRTFYDYLSYEGLVEANPVDPIRKRYLQSYKSHQGHTHQIISVDDAARLINSLVDVRDKAFLTLLFKTGIRRRELIMLDTTDITWPTQSITLKPTAKRTNRVVFFDDEAAGLLKRWLKAREVRVKPGEVALFVSTRGRLRAGGIDKVIHKAALKAELYDTSSDALEDHFSAHCCRHWFTTHLRRAGMSREFIQELRGDARRDAIDIYDHIELSELRESYLAHIPQLGV